jgi:UDP-N-acetyl-D-mannosaminuronate dehydrogenase
VDKLVTILDKESITSIVMVGAAFKEDTDDLRNSPTLDIYQMLEEKNIQTLIYDEMVELESFNLLDDLDDISEKSLIVLMYPVKKALMEKIDSVISRTQSILYTPW